MAELQPLVYQPSKHAEPLDVSVQHISTSAESHQFTQVPQAEDLHKASTRTPRPFDRVSEAWHSHTDHKQSFLKSWTLELLGCLLAVVALAAIVITLAIQDGRPSPKWPQLITINSLISVFTAIMKAAMMVPITEGICELKWIWFSSRSRRLINVDHFDEASRGPLGAMNLLFRVPKACLACFGAIITIFALAIDPFTQQVLQFYDCLQPTGQNASISRVNVYNKPQGGAGGLFYALDPPMLATVYQGLLNPPANASAAITTVCATGECGFRSGDSNNTYHSVGMAFELTDISDQVIVPPDNDPSSAFWTFSLPSGLQIGGPGIHLAPLTTMSVDASSNDTKPPLFEFEILSSTSDDPSGLNTKAIAFRARLFPCLNTYSDANISRSVFHENLVSSTPLSYVQDYPQSYFGLAGNYPAVSGIDCSPSNQAQGNKTEPTRLLLDGTRYAPMDTYNSSWPDVLWFDPLCTYTFARGPTYALSTRLQSFFGGATTNSVDPSSSSGPNNLTWVSEGDTLVDGDLWLQSMWAMGQGNTSTVTAVIQGLTNSMTAAIRSRGDNKDSQQPGNDALMTTYATQTCLRVHWAWLTFNIVLVGLTLLFFVVTFYQSYKLNIRFEGHENAGSHGAWKSSSLPLLWCGIDDAVRNKAGHPGSMGEMKRSSNVLSVQLGKRHDGAPRTFVADEIHVRHAI